MSTSVIYHQDCLEFLQCSDHHYGAVVFSPPYNNGTAYQGYRDQKTTPEYLREAWALGIMLERRTRPGASVWLNLGPNRAQPHLPGRYLREFCRGGHWRVQNQIIWVKAATLLDDEGQDFNFGHHRPNGSAGLLWSGWEWVYHLVREADYPVRLNRLALGVPYSDKSNLKRFGHTRDLRCRGNVWEIPYLTNQSKVHPASFPPELAWRCLALTHGNGTVLDPYCGAGNTGLAAQQMEADFHGVDISYDYCQVARLRLGLS